MDSRDFLEVADRLSRGASAAEFRTSIGRSYYAAFNVAADRLRSAGFPIGRGGAAHGEIRYCLANAGDADIQEAATKLGELHSIRIRADYHLARTDVEAPGIAVGVAAKAAKVIDSIDQAFRGPTRAQLQAAISKWRRDNGYP